MNTTIGDILSPSGREQLRMWDGKVSGGSRPLRRHLHSRFEIGYIKKGSGLYITKNGNYRFEAGDMFVFPPNVAHCITEIYSDTLEYTNIHFEPRFLSDDPDVCYTYSQNFKFKISGDGELYSIFCAVRRETESKRQGQELCVKSLINLFIVQLLRSYGFAGSEGYSTLTEAVKFIDKNYTKQITLGEISAVAGLTPTYFCERFKKLVDMTPWEYITTKRIERAIRLLRSDNGMNILDIALACGFNNTANFNKLFRAGTGMTPTEIRRSKDIII